MRSTRRALALTTPDVAGGPLHLRIFRDLLADLLEDGRVDEFAASLDVYERVAAELTSPRDTYWAAALRATQHTLHGDLAAAAQHARGAALRGRELQQDATGAQMLQTFVIHFQQSRLREDLTLLHAVEGLSSPYRVGTTMAVLAWSETQQPEDVESIARQVLGADGRDLLPDAFWLGAVAMLAAALAPRCRDDTLLDLLERLLEPCAEHVVVFGAGGAVFGTGHHWLGELALAARNRQRALEHLERAVALSEQLSAPYWLAQAELDTATALRLLGGAANERRAATLERRARETAERQGYARLLDRAP